MTHRASAKFWKHHNALPRAVQRLARRSFSRLTKNPSHPSLQLKPVGNYWSVRVGLSHRALAVKDGDSFVWFWIGPHDEYERLIG